MSIPDIGSVSDTLLYLCIYGPISSFSLSLHISIPLYLHIVHIFGKDVDIDIEIFDIPIEI